MNLPKRHFGRAGIARLLPSALVLTCCALVSWSKCPAQATTDDLSTPLPDAGASGQYPEVNDALVRFRNADFEGARQLLESAKRNHEELPAAGVMMAQLFFAAKQTALGRATLEDVIKSDPSDPEPYVLFGEIALGERRETDAEQLYRRASQLIRDMQSSRKAGLQKRALSGLAAVAEARQDWTESERMLQAAISAAPDDAKLRTRMARVLLKLERDADAYKLLDEVWKQNNSTSRPEITMALLYYQDDKKPSVQKNLVNKAIERDPDGLRTRLEAANWALESGDATLARSHAEKDVQLNPDSQQALLLAGLAARFDNDFDSAESVFTKAHVLSPLDFNAMNNLALTLVEQLDDAKRRRALAYAQLCQQTYTDLNQPAGREAAVTYAWVMFRLGEEAKAEAALQKMSRLWGAVTSESAYYGARIFHARGKAQAALQILQPAMNKRGAFPQRAAAEELLGRLKASAIR